MGLFCVLCLVGSRTGMVFVCVSAWLAAASLAGEAAASQVKTAVQLENRVVEAENHLNTVYAEAAMPRTTGLSMVLSGALVLFVLLFLTQFRVREARKGERLHAVQTVQEKIAAVVNTPFRKLNEKLEKQQKYVSVHLTMLVLSTLLVSIGVLEVLASSRTRYSHRKKYSVLKKAQVITKKALLALVLAGFAAAGLTLGWGSLGGALYL